MKLKKVAVTVLAAAVLAAAPATVARFSPLSVTANAANALTEGDYEYSVNENGDTVTITKYVGTDTEVVIPSTLGGKPVTVIGTQAFYKCTSLKSVTIPDSVTEIGGGGLAFAYCTSLTSVTIPNGVTEIGSQAFYNCTSLKSIAIPDSVTVIRGNGGIFEFCTSLEEIIVGENNDNYSSSDGVLFNKYKTKLIYYPEGKGTTYTIPSSVTEIEAGAFQTSETLTSVTIPDSVTTIGNGAFYRCTSLKSVTIPDSVVTIGEGAFFQCTSLTHVTIPNSITTINRQTFSECKSLTSVKIPNSVTVIDALAFKECNSLTSVTIPGSVTTMADSTFYDCTTLEEIIVEKENDNYSSANGVLFNKDKTKLICYPAGKKGEYIIPDTVTEICTEAFHESALVENVTIPNTVTEINGYTFVNCRSLISATIPSSVTVIGNYDFYGCTSLKTVNYGGTKADWEAIEIGEKNECLTNAEIICTDGIINERKPVEVLKPGDTFVDDVLEYKVLDDGTLEVKGFASADLKETVKDLIIPEETKGKKITSIGIFAFYCCNGLTSVAIPDSVTNIGGQAFKLCSGLTSITIPNGVPIIDGELFCGCTSLTSVEIPNSVERIGVSAFKGCTSLTSITIPNSVTIIGGKAFYGCTSLTSITIPNSVTAMGENVFFGCTGLTEINVTANNKSYCSEDGVLFSNDKTKLIQYPIGKSAKSYTIPNGVTSIDSGAFSGCTSLTSVTIPNSVTDISDGKFIPGGAFSGCTSLTSITIPNSVTRIGDITFYGCTNLTSITISEGVTSISNNIFSNCTSLTSITIPNNVTQIGYYALSNCTALKSVTIPNSVTKIVFNAFDLCTSLETVYYNATKADWEAIEIGDNNECLTNAEIICTDGIINEREPAKELNPGDTFVNGDLEYKVLNDGTLEVKGFANAESKKAAKVVMIPEENKGRKVTSIGYGAFSGCSLTGVTIPGNVTNIAHEAFKGCTNLTSIIIPNSVTSIGYWAFDSCTNLASVTIPDSVKSIGDSAFYGCKALTSITIPNSITNISHNVFMNSGLISVTIPNGVKTIDDSAFDGCTNLTSVSIPSSVTSIGTGIFRGCISLEQIEVDPNNADFTLVDGVLFNKSKTELICYPAKKNGTSYEIPGTVTTIRHYAFDYCKLLSSVTIPDSVTTIGSTAFDSCTSLLSVTIPNSVTTIGSYIFSNCTSLTSAVIHDSLTTISYAAFSGCGALSSVIIPNSVTVVDEWAFHDCFALATVNYGGTKAEWNAIEIRKYNECLKNAEIICTDGIINERNPVAEELKPGDTFADGILEYKVLENGTLEVKGFASADLMKTVKDLIIPEESKGKKVTSIGYEAFKHCSLTSVEIPGSVTKIGHYAFDFCTSLTSVTIPNGVKEIGAHAFDTCVSLASVTIPGSVTEIGASAFTSCKSLTSVTIPYGVKKLNYQVFNRCDSLTSVEIPNSVTSIGDQAFYACTSLKNLTVPDSVTEIGEGVFTYCKSLEEFTVGENNADYSVIDGILFNKDKTVLVCYPAGKKDASYIVPESVTTIFGYAFHSCSSLTSVTISDNVKEIGSGVFGECASLTGMTIPNGIKTISSGTFCGCTSLPNVTIPGSITAIHYQAFDGCTKLTDVYFGGSKSQWEKISVNERNDPLKDATIHFAKEDTVKPGTGGSTGNRPSTGDTSEPTASDTSEPTTSDTSEPTTSDTSEPTTSDMTQNLQPGDYFVEGNLEYTVLKDGTVEVRGLVSSEASEVVIPETVRGKKVTSIGDAAFMDCSSITNVTIPDSVTRIGGFAFSGCTSLDTVNYGGRKSDWGSIKIDIENKPLTNADIIFAKETIEVVDEDSYVKAEISTEDKELDGAEFEANPTDYPTLLDLIKKILEKVVSTVPEDVRRSLDEAAETVKDGEGFAYDISFKKDEKEIQPGRTVTVSVPIPDNFKKDVDRLNVYHLTDRGAVLIPSWIENNLIIFKTNSFSPYLITTEKLVNAVPGETEKEEPTSGTTSPTDKTPGDNPSTGIAVALTPAVLVAIAAAAVVIFRKKET